MKVKRGMLIVVLLVLTIFMFSMVGGATTCTTAGETDCSGTCVDTKTSSSNCGACGTACTSGQSCTSGKCVTTPAASTSSCTSATDCKSGEVCTSGKCVSSSGSGLYSGLLPTNKEKHHVLGRSVDAPSAYCYCDSYELADIPLLHIFYDHLDCWIDANGDWCAGIEYLHSGENINTIDDDDYSGIYLKEKKDIDDTDDCGADDDYKTRTQVGEKGCLVMLIDTDDDDDDAAVSDIAEGFILDKNYDNYPYFFDKYTNDVKYGWRGKTEYKAYDLKENYIRLRPLKTQGICDGDEYNDAGDGLKLAYYRTDNPYLCGQDYYWYKCTTEKKGTLAWANDYLYNCSLDVYDNPYWNKIDIDKDNDGYTVDKDCADDPKAAGLQQHGCPTDLGTESCDPVKHSQCAICINPGRPETCGDGLNNDCDLGKNSLKQLGGKTNDDCHLNEYGCENKPKIDKNGISSPLHTNIFGEALSWKKINGTGYCCGAGGIKDLGINGSTTEGDFICLNNDKDLVGKSGSSIPGWDTKLCGDNWCWIWATGTAGFKVLTIKKPGEQPYDVVSNNEKWYACKGKESKLELPLSAGDKTVGFDKVANRFYCYQEGERWSWTECYGKNVDQKNTGSIKGRYEGESLYNLYLAKANTDGEVYGSGIEINTNQGGYKDFYGTMPFDFSNYDYFNFMVRFVDKTNKPITADKLTLPANVNLQIYGPKQADKKNILYFDQNVLGYTVNGPAFGKDNWMHIRIPIEKYQGVELIKIKSLPEENVVAIKNIYLSKNETNTMLCSGEDSRDYNSWLTDLDQSTLGNPITGEKLCKATYGTNAWLGSYGKKEVEQASGSCCGNTLGEYYAQDSKNNYGCWNSQPLAPKGTMMNVEFKVTSQEKEIEIDYTLKDYKYSYKIERGNYVLGKYYYDDTKRKIISPSNVPIDPKTKPTGDDGRIIKIISGVDQLNKDITIEYCIKQAKGVCVYWEAKTPIPGEKSGKIGFTGVPKKIGEIKINKKDYVLFYEGGYYGTFTLTNTDKDIDIYFYDPLYAYDLETKFEAKDLYNPTNNTIYIMAEYNKATTKPVKTVTKTTTKTYNCNQEECLYPLPGLPTYTITNPHPDLYELYFVDKDGETLIEGTQTFTTEGNIKAKKVSAQIIFINQEASSNSTQDQGFYGCQAASFIENITVNGTKLITNLNYCSVKGDQFCSFSASHTKEKEKYTTINTWSKEDLTKIGYAPLATTATIPDYFSLIKGAKETAEKRNYSASVVPGRNFISNAEFTFENKELPHWEIWKSNKLETDEKQYLGTDGKTLEIPTTVKLRSERIAVPQKTDLSFSQNKSSSPTIYLVDKDGTKSTITSPLKFNTGTNSYLIIEFNGISEINQPFLQVVDELGPAKYTYRSGSDYEERSGAACCPDNYCWNGYACLKPMDTYSYMTEKINPGREYRCLQGDWKYLPPQWDWNYGEYGFCNKPDQCFVLSSLQGGDSTYLANDFYSGKIPTCVNEGEYIFDNYCENGNWTSRTKFLADTLIDFAESDDYVLYCTDYKGNLIDYKYQENYIGGATATTLNTSVGLSSAITNTTTVETSQSCFPSLLGGKGEKLITEKQNTCVNNVCVLRFKESGDFKTAFATSLNRDLKDTNSFLRSLNQDPSQVTCAAGTGFVKCTSSTLKGDFWYNNKTNSIIYGKEGIKLSGTVWGSVKKWFSGLFGGPKISLEKKMVQKGTVFRELFLLNKDKKKVRAIQEIFPKKKILVAEYEGFKSPVCDYLNYLKIPAAAQAEVLETASGLQKLNCTTNNTIQTFVALESLDFWWPQLTGMLRVNE